VGKQFIALPTDQDFAIVLAVPAEGKSSGSELPWRRPPPSSCFRIPFLGWAARCSLYGGSQPFVPVPCLALVAGARSWSPALAARGDVPAGVLVRELGASPARHGVHYSASSVRGFFGGLWMVPVWCH